MKWGDTDLIPEGGGTGGSRSLQQGGAAVQQASRDLVDVARERAADELEADPDDLVFDTGAAAFAVRRRTRTRRSRWPALAEQSDCSSAPCSPRPARRSRSARTSPWPRSTPRPARRCCAGWSTVDDAGTVINPLLAEGQRHGGIAQGAAQALLEEVVYDDDGNPLTTTFADYPFVSADRGAQLRAGRHGDADHRTTRSGPRASGRPGTIGSTPAVQNAVIDALAHLGVRHIDMPASPQRVWQALRVSGNDEEPARRP